MKSTAHPTHVGATVHLMEMNENESSGNHVSVGGGHGLRWGGGMLMSGESFAVGSGTQDDPYSDKIRTYSGMDGEYWVYVGAVMEYDTTGPGPGVPTFSDDSMVEKISTWRWTLIKPGDLTVYHNFEGSPAGTFTLHVVSSTPELEFVSLPSEGKLSFVGATS